MYSSGDGVYLAHYLPKQGSFAALHADGQVISCGNPAAGGCSASVREHLRNIQKIQGNDSAFAAIANDNTVVCWGNLEDGGNDSGVASQLREVRDIQATSAAFAAIRQDMAVITWRCPYSGGDSSHVNSLLRQIAEIHPSHSAFAALRSDGRIIAWGNHSAGGIFPDAWKYEKSRPCKEISLVLQLCYRTTVLLRARGHVQTTDEAEMRLSQPFRCIAATAHAFAGLTEQGRIVAWGVPEYGGDASSVQLRESDGGSGTGSNLCRLCRYHRAWYDPHLGRWGAWWRLSRFEHLFSVIYRMFFSTYVVIGSRYRCS